MPWVLGVAGGAALLTGVLHLIAAQRPTVLLLPTARFVPTGEARAVARQPRPTHLLLLTLRVSALLLAGAAAAGVRWRPSASHTAVLVVADARARADSARWLAPLLAERVGDRRAEGPVVPAVRWVRGADADAGVLLVEAQRAAQQLVQDDPTVSRIALVVGAPPRSRAWRGYAAWRSAWPGAMSVVPVDAGAVGDDTSAAAAAVRVVGARGDDAVAAAISARNGAAGDAPIVTIDRSVGTPAEVTSDASILVRWPVDGVPAGWEALPAAQTVGALTAGEAAVVAPWTRRARLPNTVLADTSARPIAWWSDGHVAAVERLRAVGCTREVGVVAAAGTDLLLSAPAAGLLRALTAPCGHARPAPASVWRDRVASLDRDTLPTVDANAWRAGVSPAQARPSLMAVLCALAALLLLTVEGWVRRQTRSGGVRSHASQLPAARAPEGHA
ncbi:MAG: hypothetical protein LCH84_14520 [Gemmatimonadetes bacterium]|nr:hypothetical protein [Gemmatimonadota bacterium]